MWQANPEQPPIPKPVKSTPFQMQGPQVAPIPGTGGEAMDSVGVAPPPMPLGASTIGGGFGQNTGINGGMTATRSTPSTMTSPDAQTTAPLAGNDFWASVRGIQDLGAGRGVSDGAFQTDPAATPGAEGVGVRPPPFTMNSNGMPGAMPGAMGANPGVSTSTSQPWNGAPSVTSARVGFDGLPELDTDFSAASQRGADAAYRGATQYLDEDFGKDRSALESRLASQGFAVGSEGYKNELDRMERGHNATRENAAFVANDVGHRQAGDFLTRALQARGQLVGERGSDADRTYAQSLGIANLGLGARGQDKGVETAGIGAAASANSANAAAQASMYGTDANASVALRRLGLDENNQSYQQLMQLISGARGGVNMPNFGTPTPLDVGGANSIASNNANSAANRTASDRAALYQLGGSVLGNINWGALGGP